MIPSHDPLQTKTCWYFLITILNIFQTCDFMYGRIPIQIQRHVDLNLNLTLPVPQFKLTSASTDIPFKLSRWIKRFHFLETPLEYQVDIYKTEKISLWRLFINVCAIISREFSFS